MFAENYNKMNRKKIKLTQKQIDKIIIALAKRGHCAKRDLADYLGISQSGISLWIKAKFIPAKHLDKVNEWLGINV